MSPAYDGPLVAFSPEMATSERALKRILYPAILYRHPKVLRRAPEGR